MTLDLEILNWIYEQSGFAFISIVLFALLWCVHKRSEKERAEHRAALEKERAAHEETRQARIAELKEMVALAQSVRSMMDNLTRALNQRLEG